MPVSALTLAAGHVVTAAEATRMAEATQPYVDYTPTAVNVSVSSISGRYFRHGDKMSYDFTMTLSGAPSGTILVSLPVEASAALGPFALVLHPRGVCMSLGAGTTVPGFISLYSSNTCRLVTTGGVSWSNTTPSGLASGYIISGHLEYEAA